MDIKNTNSSELSNPFLNSISSDSSSSLATSSESSGFFSGLQNISIYTWLIIILLLSFLGFNIFAYLAKGTQEVADVSKPFVENISYLFANISSLIVGSVASITRNVLNITTDILDTGLSKVEERADKVQESTSNKISNSQNANANKPNINKPNTDMNKNKDDDVEKQMDNNSLNKALNTSKAKENSATNNDYSADESTSTIQSGGSKSGWCYIGEDRGFRSCVEVGQNDQCMSGDIFSSKEICVNPNLRP
jgi:hypothetical protein